MNGGPTAAAAGQINVGGDVSVNPGHVEESVAAESQREVREADSGGPHVRGVHRRGQAALPAPPPDQRSCV